MQQTRFDESDYPSKVVGRTRGDDVRTMMPRALLQAGIAHCFQCAVSGINITKDKPNAELFLTAARQLGVTAAECVVFEDVAAGVQAAKQGGLYCLYCAAIDQAGQPDRLQGADQLIGYVAELAPSRLFAIDTGTGDV